MTEYFVDIYILNELELICFHSLMVSSIAI